MPKASAFGGRGHIPLLHPPPMASKTGHAQLRRILLLLHLTEHPPHKNPGYAPDMGRRKQMYATITGTIATRSYLFLTYGVLNRCPLSLVPRPIPSLSMLHAKLPTFVCATLKS